MEVGKFHALPRKFLPGEMSTGEFGMIEWDAQSRNSSTPISNCHAKTLRVGVPRTGWAIAPISTLTLPGTSRLFITSSLGIVTLRLEAGLLKTVEDVSHQLI